ncbi:MAG: type VII secretion integral membrane protein EccD [Actinocatenispora sp.]
MAAPKRRLEVALPEHLPLSALLPALLRQGGEDLANDGLSHGGWTMRRADGSSLDQARTLAAQAVRDGEVLHLVPRYTEWPELQYDDIVDAIATGAKRGGPPWTKAATRAAGLAITALFLLLIPLTLLMTGGRWIGPGIAALALSVLLVVAGIALSRALADSVAGAIIGALSMPYGLLGGLLILGGQLKIQEFGSPQLLMGSVSVLALAVIGYFGVADLRRLFVAGIVTGLGGAVGALLGLTAIGGAGASAIVVTLFLVISPAYPLLSVRLGKVPMPAVPRDAEDLRAHDVLPPLEQTVARVARSTELLTGALLGTAAVTVVGVAVLAATDTVSGLLLAGIVSVAHLLRARMLVATRQRVAPLISGVLGVVATVLGLTVMVPSWSRFAFIAPGLLVIAVLICAAAMIFSRRPPSPYLGRVADILDVLLTLAAAPVAAQVLGLYHVIRGLAG